MSPERQALRDAWISEMWAPVEEYREHSPRPVRNPKPDVRPEPREDQLECPFCGDEFALRRLPKHLWRVHSALYEEVA